MCRCKLSPEVNSSVLCLLDMIKHSFVNIIQCPDWEKKTTDHEKWFKCLQKLNASCALVDCVYRPRSRFCTKYWRFTTRASTFIAISLYSLYSFSLPHLSNCKNPTKNQLNNGMSLRIHEFWGIFHYSIDLYYILHLESGYYKCTILPDCTIHVLQGGKSFD